MRELPEIIRWVYETNKKIKLEEKKIIEKRLGHN